MVVSTLPNRHLISIPVQVLDLWEERARRLAGGARSPQFGREMTLVAENLHAAAQIARGRREACGELKVEIDWLERLGGVGVINGREGIAVGRLLGPTE